MKYGKRPDTTAGLKAAKELLETSGGIEMCERVERYIWQLSAGYIDGPPEEMVEATRMLLESSDTLSDFDESKAAEWADEAQRKLLALKIVWQDFLIRAFEIGEL